MISKTLLKLIDEAILPAIVLVAAKIIGVSILSMRLGLDFTLNLKGIEEPNASLVNTYSNLLSYGAIALGLSFILARAYFFHSSHISPQITLRLSSWNFTSIISTTYELFNQAVVWLSYLWLLSLLFLLQSYWKLVAPNIALGMLVVTLIFTCLFVRDADREIDIRRMQPWKKSLIFFRIQSWQHF